MIAAYSFYFEQPWWLAAGLIAVPIAYVAWRSLRTMGTARRVATIALRVAVILVLAAVLARPAISETHDNVAMLAVMDRSQSVPDSLKSGAHNYLTTALKRKTPGDMLAVIDIAEQADIARLPSTAKDVPVRTLTLLGNQSRLAAGVQMALAIAPPNTAVRILLISDGNETAGDLQAVARVAAANHIPIDVLPLHYKYDHEVIFRRLVTPSRARSGQTIPIRFVLTSTAPTSGRLQLTCDNKPIDLDPTSDSVSAPIKFDKAGTKVHTIPLPIGTEGVYQFDARYVPDNPADDRLSQNNRASAVTLVAGPGHILVVSTDAREAAPLMDAMKQAKIDARSIAPGEFPTDLPGLLDVDAIVLVNTPNHLFSMGQQDMICRYVVDLGGGLVMVGGPKSFGAGGWIGSPVAKILPVDMDPPQKKQMPKGALVLIMHACEMPQGNYWGKKVAAEAVKVLSRHDLIGVLDYSWNAGAGGHWVYPLSPAGDKTRCIDKINNMEMGDMPDFGAPVQAAYNALTAAKAGQKHIIIISDGDPQIPSATLIKQCRAAGITITGVGVFPHDPSNTQSLQLMARATGGRFYNPKNANDLPKIFVKEAQVVRRSLIIEDPVQPRIVSGLNDILRGVRALPVLDGRVLTGPKGGLAELVLATPDKEPLLATEQAGLGRVAAFTSSADSRWAGKWLAWGGFNRFWEQTIRWTAKNPQATDCETFADVQGRDVTLTVEAVKPGGQFVQFANIVGQVIAPDMSTHPLELRQVGPGQYRAHFQAEQGGSYMVNLRYRRAGEGQGEQLVQSVVTVPFAPEFEDLTDNTALLSQVARTSGGRVLNVDPNSVDLFSRAGLALPTTATPQTIPLLIIWVILFLFDVAVRRIAIDFAAVARRLRIATPELFGASAVAAAAITLGVLLCIGSLPLGLGLGWHIAIAASLLLGAAGWLLRGLVFQRAAAAGVDATLSALKARRKSVQQRLKAEGRSDQAARRFQAPKGKSTKLPEADTAKTPPARRPPPADQAKKPAPAADDGTHVSRLLDAKRRAKRQSGDDKK